MKSHGLARKLVIVSLGILLSALLVVSACAQQPAPASPTAKPAPVTSPTPAASTPAASPSPSAKPVAQHAPTTVQIIAPPMGVSAYALTFKIAELLNKNHPWLKLEAVEGMGTIPAMQAVMDKPALAKTQIWNSVSAVGQFARTAQPPFKKTYKDSTGTELLTAFNTYPNIMLMCTTKPELKTITDLSGKKVLLSQKGMAGTYLMEKIFEKYNLTSKVNFQYMDYGAMCNALRDGLADAGILVSGLSPDPNAFTATPAYQELYNSRTVYPISLGDEKVLNELVKEGIPVYPVTLPAGKKILNQVIPAPTVAYYQGVNYYTDITMDADVVYEVVKSIYENIDTLKTIDPSLKVMSTDLLGNVESEALFHPGAIKFLKEKGIKVGFHGL